MNEKKKYPFDINKSYCYQREALMSGSRCKIEIAPDDILTAYEYTKPANEFEDGMSDNGADIYFVGRKEGIATVTVTIFYPTCEPDIISFDLCVNEDMFVSNQE